MFYNLYKVYITIILRVCTGNLINLVSTAQQTRWTDECPWLIIVIKSVPINNII